MRSLLQQLENNEAILLMYLAGELPENDRAEVDEMLARDPALRAELAALTSLHGEVTGLMSSSQVAPAVNRAQLAASRLAPELRTFAAARRRPEVEFKPSRTLRLARLLYPLAAAAVVLVAFVIWWNTQRPPRQIANNDRLPTPVRVAPDPEIFRVEAPTEGLERLEDEVVKLASGDEDPLGFRTWNRQ